MDAFWNLLFPSPLLHFSSPAPPSLLEAIKEGTAASADDLPLLGRQKLCKLFGALLRGSALEGLVAFAVFWTEVILRLCGRARWGGRSAAEPRPRPRAS